MVRSLRFAALLSAAFLAGLFAHSFGGTVSAQTPAPQVQLIHLADYTGPALTQVAPGVKIKGVAASPSGDVGVLEINNIPRHRHNHTDEIIYVIDGTMTATFGDKQYDVKTGDLIVLPHGIPHAFSSPGGARLLGIAYPKDPTATDMEMLGG